MSDADRDDLTVSADGVSVRKSVDTTRFDPTAIVLTVRSERDEPAHLRLLDRIPDGVSPDDVGFHSEYDADHWSVEADAVVFERTVEPGEEYTTLYGLREFDEADLDRLSVEPELAVLDEAPEDSEELAQLLSKTDNQPVKEVIAGDRDTLPGLDEDGADDIFDGEPETTPEEGVAGGADDLVDIDDSLSAADDETAEADDTEADEEGDAETAGAPATDQPEADQTRTDESDAEEADETEADEADDDTGGRAVADHPEGGVARVLAKELREDNVSEADRELLRAELGPDTSTEVRIESLQSQMSDLAAYTDALEEFLDEEGTAQEILGDLTDRTDRLDDRLTEFEGELGDLQSDMQGLEGELSTVSSDLDDLETRLEDVTDRVDDVERLETRIDDLTEDLSTVRSDIDEMAQFRDRLETALGRLTGVAPEESDSATDAEE